MKHIDENERELKEKYSFLKDRRADLLVTYRLPEAVVEFLS